MQQKHTETPSDLLQILEFPSTDDGNITGDPTSASLFDWSNFLDFDLDDNLNLAFDPQAIHGPESESGPGVDPIQPQSQQPKNSTRVRKRDPRLVCSNFLAGRIPCACPELDAKLEEEESGDQSGKKRVRTVRVPVGATARCQVPECEADISKLKGYHKRHRVCLQCANASVVVLDGESKRYCQQCGKFHILSDFDEGKRSCRRKLERHNNRRRRRPNDSKGSTEKESLQVVLVDDVSCNADKGKDSICLSSQIAEPEILLESEGHMSTINSGLGSQTIQRDTFLAFAASGETHLDGEKEKPKQKYSPSYCENNSSFSSLCPAVRISFKLYDWNPAEFPRRLRHQIFEWLASMPVELEGYIRPGCTILTAFIAVPKVMWLKLLEEPAKCIQELLASPGNMLSGRMHVYLYNKIFRVTKDDCVVEVKVNEQAPKLHYVYPTCFEAGKPLEFVACGTNLLQPKFRFLVSFGGQYLAYNICVSSIGCKKEGDTNSVDHQLLKIYVPPTDLYLFGPAFIEVENLSGLSNFIPILIGNKEVCVEMELLQKNFNTSLGSEEQQFSLRSACEILATRQAEFSRFLLEVAWSLKKPISEQPLTSTQVQRFNYLLNFLIERESAVILERILHCMKSKMDNNFVVGISDADMKLLRVNMDNVRNVLHQTLEEKKYSVRHALDGNFFSQISQHDSPPVPATNQGLKWAKNNLESRVALPSLGESATVPLLNGELLMSVNLEERPGKSCSRLFTMTVVISHPLVFAIAAVGVCFGICAVVLHPQKVSELATTIARCLFDDS
ncbi:squamosa promoter-binding-like protein 7 isoform X1 [Olea europaea var. sylvestris]|uniref:squamosa promoter-binding-like protein 7 isoform X1 n=1 Tax=Olea europaea var. sylvestris TaxID=158386 RepID=UPI000C1CFD36|nr:squamosa promoter-binding-like protein 7 isoform X1 [Olea europaea var. sylvestris]